MMKFKMIPTATLTALMLIGCGSDSDGEEIAFAVNNAAGERIGTLELEQQADGGVEIEVELSGLTPGVHAMHFHEVGRCDAPDFKTAGGHYNPASVAHGQVEDGPHAGDMMNIELATDGTGDVEITNEKVNIRVGGALPALMDADGSALIIHAGADDYKSQPSGAAGARVACAVISAG